MKKPYNSPELEIVKFTSRETIAYGIGDNMFSAHEDDIFIPVEETEE